MQASQATGIVGTNATPVFVVLAQTDVRVLHRQRFCAGDMLVVNGTSLTT